MMLNDKCMDVVYSSKGELASCIWLEAHDFPSGWFATFHRASIQIKQAIKCETAKRKNIRCVFVEAIFVFCGSVLQPTAVHDMR